MKCVPSNATRWPSSVNGAENAEKDFLGEVEGLVAVAQEVQGELVDHAFVAGYQFGAGGGLSRGTALD